MRSARESVDFPCAPNFVSALAHEGLTQDYPREWYEPAAKAQAEPTVTVRSLLREVQAQGRLLRQFERRLLQLERKIAE